MAWFYDRYWGSRFPDWAFPAIERLVLAGLSPRGRVLDLGFGTGDPTRMLGAPGFAVVGVDYSAAMLRFARRRLGRVPLVAADARRFGLAPVFAAGIAPFDAMNHFLTAEELSQALRNVRASLRPGAVFVFDV